MPHDWVPDGRLLVVSAREGLRPRRELDARWRHMVIWWRV
jgi:hypothetical protein